MFTLRKNTYSLNMLEHNIFGFIFRSKMMTIKDGDNFDGAFPFDSLFEQLIALINFFLFLVPVNKVPYCGHCMMGLELKIDISVAPLVLNSI